jgi:transcription elongation factor GreA-like protein
MTIHWKLYHTNVSSIHISHLQKEYVRYIHNIFPEWLARYSTSLLNLKTYIWHKHYLKQQNTLLVASEADFS